MWQAMVASWLMAISCGQLELNGPQNAPPRNESAVVQPADTPSADDATDQSTSENTTLPAETPAATAPRAIFRDNSAPIRTLSPLVDAPVPPTPPAIALPKPIITKQMYFSLPARNGPAPANNGQIVEVQLFVSHDRGAKWNFYTRVKPDQARIPFRTNSDGELWFATRTLDKSGRFEPAAITQPTIVVEIDTKPPVILLSADSSTDGRITARWEITDPHLKTDSLVLQYRTANNAPWQSVAVHDKDSSVAESSMSGETTWRPSPGLQDIVVRAEVADALGNKAVAHAQAKPGAQRDAVNNSNLRKNEQAGARPQPANPNPKFGNKFSGETNSSLLDNPYLAYLPPSEKARMVNSRVFELDYDLEYVGPSGVSRVELFGTRDGGKTWKSFGVDADNRSPMTVRVEDEGLYGFQIVVTSGAGVGDPPPKSGDAPAIWIGVDLTRPMAKITSLDFGTDNGGNQLIIGWEASDKMPSERPITLSYSTQPNGQFTTFAANQENAGRYVWDIEPGTPPIIYLRLEVVDEAGNRTTIDHPQPISLDRSKPTVRIRDVRAAGK